MFDEIMNKKRKGMSDLEKEAKLGVLQFISDSADDAIANKISGLKKVTIASNSDEGIKKGLELVKKKLGEQEEKDIEAVNNERTPMDMKKEEKENDEDDKYELPEDITKQLKRVLKRASMASDESIKQMHKANDIDDDDDEYELPQEIVEQVKKLVKKNKQYL